MIDFEWDNNKASNNLNKHDVSFKEAMTVFGDPFARIIADPDHLIEEERFIILGLSNKARELVVCYCLRELEGSIVRIISARKAARTEARQYWRHVNV